MINRLKKFIKKYYNGDIQYFVSSTKFKIIFELILFTTGFLITWLFANYSPQEFYGNYLYILSIGSLFSFLSFSGIASSIQQAVASKYERFYISGMKALFKYSILGSISIFTFSLFYLFFFEIQISVLISIYIIGLFFPFSSALSAFHFYLDGKMQFKKDLYYRLINLIVQDSFLLLLIFLTRNLILHFFLLNIITLILNINITRSCVKSLNTETIIIEKETKALKYGLFLTKIGIIANISVNINNILIGMIFNPATLAFYIIGIGLPNKLINLIKSSLSTLLSKFSKEGEKFRKSFIVFILITSILLFFLVIFILPLFMKILFPNYLDSVILGFLYSFLILIVPISTAFGYYFRGKTDIKTIQSIILYPNIAKLLFLVPFIFLFNIYGIIFLEYLLWIIRLIVIFISLRKKNNYDRVSYF